MAGLSPGFVSRRRRCITRRRPQNGIFDPGEIFPECRGHLIRADQSGSVDGDGSHGDANTSLQVQPEDLPWVVEEAVVPCACGADDGACAHEDGQAQEAAQADLGQSAHLDFVE